MRGLQSRGRLGDVRGVVDGWPNDVFVGSVGLSSLMLDARFKAAGATVRGFRPFRQPAMRSRVRKTHGESCWCDCMLEQEKRLTVSPGSSAELKGKTIEVADDWGMVQATVGDAVVGSQAVAPKQLLPRDGVCSRADSSPTRLFLQPSLARRQQLPERVVCSRADASLTRVFLQQTGPASSGCQTGGFAREQIPVKRGSSCSQSLLASRAHLLQGVDVKECGTKQQT